MARLLHMLTGDTRHWFRTAVSIGLISSVVAAAGCILPPELPVYDEEQVPPYIVPSEVIPFERVKNITRSDVEAQPTLTFSATARDWNRHERLYYVMLSTTRGIVQQGSEARSSQVMTDDGQVEYFNYLISIEGVPVCEDVPESRVETVTLYVADREFETVSPNDPDPPQLIDLGPGDENEGHIVSRSWIFEYTVDACS